MPELRRLETVHCMEWYAPEPSEDQALSAEYCELHIEYGPRLLQPTLLTWPLLPNVDEPVGVAVLAVIDVGRERL